MTPSIPAIGLQLLCLVVLSACQTQPRAPSIENKSPPLEVTGARFEVQVSQGGDDLRTREVRKYFRNLGREFEVYLVRPTEPTPAGQRYDLNRKRAGNLRYNSLTVVRSAFFAQVARSVNGNFVPLESTGHHDNSEVNGERLLQILFRNARALEKQHADLDTVKNGVTLTYVYDDHELVMAPSTFNFEDNAVNAEGTSLEKDFGVNAFSKHYLLALILNEEAQVTMAGKIYIAVRSLDDEHPRDLAHVFMPGGDVDLEHYKFQVTVANDSGTFKPEGKELPPFAQLLVDTLGIDEVHYKAWTKPDEPPIEGSVTSDY